MFGSSSGSTFGAGTFGQSSGGDASVPFCFQSQRRARSPRKVDRDLLWILIVELIENS